MKKTLVITLVIASALIARAETMTVKGTLERSQGGSKTFVIKNPSISVMGGVLFTEPSIQDDLAAYEGKLIQITGDIKKRPAGYSAIKSIDKIEVLGE